MSDLNGKNYALVPYMPRRKSWGWGLAACILAAAMIVGLTAIPLPEPPELPCTDMPRLVTVPASVDAQACSARCEHQSSEAVVKATSTEALLVPTTEEGPELAAGQEDVPQFRLVPVPQRDSTTDAPCFDDLGQGTLKRISAELATAVSMAERGAVYAARARLIACLRWVARSLDAQANVDTHSKSLAVAFLALDEANDFDDRGTQYQADVLTRSYIAGHQTPVLKNSPTPSAVRARNAYYRFARKKLIEAAGEQKVSAELLYALGRVEAELTQQMRNSDQRRAPREIPLFEAAVAVNSRHFVAANELGVALARVGDYRRATIAFEHSTKIRPTPEGLANLEHVSRQMGDRVIADNLRQHLAHAPMKPSVLPEVAVVSLDEFNQISMPRAENSTFAINSGQQGETSLQARGATGGVTSAQLHTPLPRSASKKPETAVRSTHEWFW